MNILIGECWDCVNPGGGGGGQTEPVPGGIMPPDDELIYVFKMVLDCAPNATKKSDFFKHSDPTTTPANPWKRQSVLNGAVSLNNEVLLWGWKPSDFPSLPLDQYPRDLAEKPIVHVSRILYKDNDFAYTTGVAAGSVLPIPAGWKPMTFTPFNALFSRYDGPGGPKGDWHPKPAPGWLGWNADIARRILQPSGAVENVHLPTLPPFYSMSCETGWIGGRTFDMTSYHQPVGFGPPLGGGYLQALGWSVDYQLRSRPWQPSGITLPLSGGRVLRQLLGLGDGGGVRFRFRLSLTVGVPKAGSQEFDQVEVGASMFDYEYGCNQYDSGGALTGSAILSVIVQSYA